MTTTVPVTSDVQAPNSDAKSSPWLFSSILLMISAVLLGLVVFVVLVSQVLNARDQTILRSDFRSDLANAIAPVGPADLDGALLKPGTAIGLISIRALGVDAVLVEGTTSAQTATGPGHKTDSAFPGQAGVSIIYGRQAAYGGAFKDIGSLKAGDGLSITTGQGELTYKVLDVRVEGDPLPPALSANESRVVLVSATGTPYLPKGVVRVDATLVTPLQPSSGISLPSQGEAAQPMHGDSSAWLGVFLWSQALLLVVLLFTWCRIRWGGWQAWVVGVPVLTLIALALGSQITQLLPNLM